MFSKLLKTIGVTVVAAVGSFKLLEYAATYEFKNRKYEIETTNHFTGKKMFKLSSPYGLYPADPKLNIMGAALMLTYPVTHLKMNVITPCTVYFRILHEIEKVDVITDTFFIKTNQFKKMEQEWKINEFRTGLFGFPNSYNYQLNEKQQEQAKYFAKVAQFMTKYNQKLIQNGIPLEKSMAQFLWEPFICYDGWANNNQMSNGELIIDYHNGIHLYTPWGKKRIVNFYDCASEVTFSMGNTVPYIREEFVQDLLTGHRDPQVHQQKKNLLLDLLREEKFVQTDFALANEKIQNIIPTRIDVTDFGTRHPNISTDVLINALNQ